MKRPEPMRSVNFTLTAIGLVAIAGAMLALMMITAGRAAISEGVTRSYLIRVAWLAAALLALCLLMLTWVVARHARRQLAGKKQRSETPYIDAWAEAGKRLKVEDQEDAAGEDQAGGEN